MAERITSNYNEAPNKDALLAEIEARRAEGRDIPDITASSKREDMESALELDDEARDNAATSKKASKGEGKANIPQVEVSPVPDVTTHNPPADAQFTHGTYIKISDGLPYGVAVHEPDNYGRTHSAKNSANFWQGTEKEFREQFDKA